MEKNPDNLPESQSLPLQEVAGLEIATPEDIVYFFSRAFDLLRKAQTLRQKVEDHPLDVNGTPQIVSMGPYVTGNAPIFWSIVNTYRSVRADRLEARAHAYMYGDI